MPDTFDWPESEANIFADPPVSREDQDRLMRELGRAFTRPETDTFAASVAFVRRLEALAEEYRG